MEECSEKFKKDCYIEYKNDVVQKPIEVCNEALKRDCEAEGDVVCSTEYETGDHKSQIQIRSPLCNVVAPIQVGNTFSCALHVPFCPFYK